jgi:hypothetical protein
MQDVLMIYLSNVKYLACENLISGTKQGYSPDNQFAE